MPTLTVTSRGQVTLRKEVLQHLGILPGDKIEVELMPDRQASLRASQKTGTLEEFFGIVAPYTKVKASLEEINQAAADGWAGLIK